MHASHTPVRAILSVATRATLLTLLLAFGCQGAPPTTPAAVPGAKAPAPKPSFDDVASLIPADAAVYVEGPGIQWANDQFGDLPGVEPADLVAAALAAKLGLSERALATFIKAIVSTGLVARQGRESFEVGVFARLSHAAAAEPLLSQDRFEPSGELAGGAQRYLLRDEEPADDDATVVHWYPEGRLLLVGSEPLAADISEVVAGRQPSLRSISRFTTAQASFESDVVANAFVDVASLFDDGDPSQRRVLDAVLRKRTPLTASATFKPSQRVSLRFGLSGSAMPPTSLDAPPAKLTLPDRLPIETVSYSAFSTRLARQGGDGISALQPLAELVGFDLNAFLQGAGAELGVSPDAMLGLLGDQGVVATLAPERLDLPEDSDPVAALSHLGVLAIQELSDRPSNDDTVEALLLGIAKELRGDYRVVQTKRALTAKPRQPGRPDVAIAYADGHLVIAVGAPALVRRGMDAFRHQKQLLATDEAHGATTAQREGAQVALWLDTQKLMGLMAQVLPSTGGARRLAALSRLAGAERVTGLMALRWTPQDDEWKVRLDLHDAATVGVMAAASIYGVRRYLASAKTAEAKNVIGAIARGVAAAYEREHGSGTKHRLCKSAQPVPDDGVPPRTKYQPSDRPGQDYQRGDDDTGWPCMRFGLTQPHYYRYHYNAGGNYLGPARGGPDPGPHGFEVAAEGDLDGDGETSLFTRIGRVDPKTGRLTLGTTIFIVDEFE